jgi:hypothetical protein
MAEKLLQLDSTAKAVFKCGKREITEASGLSRRVRRNMVFVGGCMLVDLFGCPETRAACIAVALAVAVPSVTVAVESDPLELVAAAVGAAFPAPSGERYQLISVISCGEKLAALDALKHLTV